MFERCLGENFAVACNLYCAVRVSIPRKGRRTAHITLSSVSEDDSLSIAVDSSRHRACARVISRNKSLSYGGLELFHKALARTENAFTNQCDSIDSKKEMLNASLLGLSAAVDILLVSR